MSGSDDGPPGVAIAAALLAGLVAVIVVAVRLAAWVLALLFSVCCVLVQC